MCYREGTDKSSTPTMMTVGGLIVTAVGEAVGRASFPPIELRRVGWTLAVTRDEGTVELQTRAIERNVDSKHRPNMR